MSRVRSNPPKNYRNSRDFWASVFAYALYRMDRMTASNVFRSIKSAGSDVGFDDASAIASQVTMMPEHQARELALVALSEYVRRSFTDASDALRWITQRDHRLGVWCAAQVARWALAIVRQQEDPKALRAGDRAVEAAEGWVSGIVTTQSAADAAYDAMVSDRGLSSAAISAISAAGHAALAACHDTDDPVTPADQAVDTAEAAAAVYTAGAYGYYSFRARDAARTSALRALVAVVADAIPTFVRS